MATIVAIGRTYGKGPLKGKRMDDKTWETFRAKTWELLTGTLKLNPYSNTTGKGWYVHEDGTPVEEETMVAVTSDLEVLDLPTLVAGLKALAGAFRQEAIALQLGETMFIKP